MANINSTLTLAKLKHREIIAKSGDYTLIATVDYYQPTDRTGVVFEVKRKAKALLITRSFKNAINYFESL